MTAVISALVGGGLVAVIELIKFLVSRKDEKKKGENQQNEQIMKIIQRQLMYDRDITRIQMLLLMNLFPKKTDELMTLAEHYFKDLQGDWWMTGMFLEWLNEQNIPRPEWLSSAE